MRRNSSFRLVGVTSALVPGSRALVYVYFSDRNSSVFAGFHDSTRVTYVTISDGIDYPYRKCVVDKRQ